MGWLEGKVALVVGGGSGIGRAVVEAYVREGAAVGVLERAPAKVEDLRTLGPAVLAVQGDATSYDDNARAVAATVERYGGLDALVCCAALSDLRVPLRELPADRIGAAFDELFAVNVKSCLLSAKAAVEPLLRSEGAIVFTSSNAAFYPVPGGPLYASSKAAIRGLVTQLAYELAPKVRVNAVAPGGTLGTDLRGLAALGQRDVGVSAMPDRERLLRAIVPLQAAGQPQDHAYAYVFLASRMLSPQVTGVILQSDGGLGVRGLTQVAGLLEP